MNETPSLQKRHKARRERRIAKREEKQKQRIKLFDNIKNVTNHDNLMKAFRNAKKGVGWKQSVQEYNQQAALNVAKTSEKIIKGEPIHKKFNQFTINERGKIRHIRSVNIDERVVQKALCDEILLPILGPTLIYDNGACLKGRGTSFAEFRLKVHLRRFYRQNGSNDGYVLSTDFKKYFDSIDHALLMEKMRRYINDPKVLALVQHFIDSFDEGNYTAKGKSIGLGSQISQVAAIYFPSCVDHFAKEVLRLPFYGRYMDDVYIIHHDREYLKYCLEKIKEICAANDLELNEKKTVISHLTTQRGVLFLKGHYHLLETGRITVHPSKAAFIRQKRKITKWRKLLERKEITIKTCMEAYLSWRGSFKSRFPNAQRMIQYMDNHFSRMTGYEVPN
jgi:hypothetical protein